MDCITWIVYAISFISIGEGLNCMYPRIDEYYDSEGMMCKWEERDFYYDKIEDTFVLFPIDSTDNCFEARARERYWRKR